MTQVCTDVVGQGGTVQLPANDAEVREGKKREVRLSQAANSDEASVDPARHP